MAPPEAPPGWYPDPAAPDHRRYWDGSVWTEHAYRPAPADGEPRGTLPPPGELPPPPAWPPPPPVWTPKPAAAAGDATPEATASAVRGLWVRSGRARTAVLLATVFVVSVVVGAVATAHGSTPAADRATVPPATVPPLTVPPTTAPVGNAAAAAALPGLVVQASDIPAAASVATIDGGDSVAGGSTLDLCNGSFPSEALRTARLQVAAGDPSGTAVLGTEAVAYTTGAATSQAFTELRSVAASCPASAVESPVGGPTLTTTFGPAPDATWPSVAGVDRLAFDVTTVAGPDPATTDRTIVVYLRRGDVLLGVYLPQRATPTPAVDGQTTAAGIVGVFASRLAQLPAGAVGG